MSVRIRLAYTIAEYDGSLLDEEKSEHAPLVQSWTSIAGRRETFFPVKWRAGTNKTKAEPIEAHAEFDAVVGSAYNPSTRVATIRLGDTFGVRIKAHAPNAQGVLSLQNCGDALIPIGQLLAEHLQTHNDIGTANRNLADLEMPVALKFHVYTDNDGSRVNKGAMLIRDLRAVVANTNQPVLLDLERDSDNQLRVADEFAYVAANERFYTAAVQNVTVRSIMMFTEDAMAQGFGFHPSSDESRRVHAPFFATVSGLLPGFTYVMRPGAAAPSISANPKQYVDVQSWMRKLCDYALARISQKDTWFIETVTKQLQRTDNTFDNEFVECANMVGQVLAIAPTSLPYVSDEVRTGARAATRLARIKTKNGYVDFKGSSDKPGIHGVERFSEEAENDGGDCEDGGMFAYRIATVLSAGEWNDPLVAAVGAVLKQYVPVVNLGSVKDASVGNDLTDNSKLKDGDIIDSEIDRKQAYGAHMWCEAVPLVKFVALVQRAVPDMDPKLLWLKGAVQAPWTAALPQLVIEATGRLDSLQLPRIAYVMNNDKELKAALLEQLETKHALIGKLLNDTKTFKCMQMVREQQDLVGTPNKRPTKFYRQTTHTFTGAFLANGLATVDFVAANLGERVPMPSNADKLFGDNLIASAMRAPGGATTPEIAAATPPAATLDANEWRDKAAFHDWSAPAASNGLKIALQLVSGMPLASSLPIAANETVVAAAAAAKPKGPFQYGVAMYDRLVSPLLQATCLVPNTPLSGREMRVVSEILRQAPPIAMPGDWEQIEAMHDAALESRLVNNGEDERAAMKQEDAQFEKLKAHIAKTVDTPWPKRGSHIGKHTLLTFFFPYGALRHEENVTAIAADIVAQRANGTFLAARLWKEEAMPYRRFAVLQVMCNAPKK